jgi:hypothetical protein
MIKPKMKEFKTRQPAMKYAHNTYKKYGFNASVFKVSKGKKVRYATLNPKSAGLKVVR